ncbi:peptidylprolyl isomerase [Brevibacillus sp. SYSU BS000544]|uniref:peptidylprolyl isomerase n=1 Tax=Brevibacillus sp. SYSU BS000544 TaxID=3416443 RepID=UPI003CE45D97
MLKLISEIGISLVTVLALVGCGTQSTTPPADKAPQGQVSQKQYEKAPEMKIDPTKQYRAVVSTTKGDFTIELFTKDAPKTVNNFVFLSNEKYYENIVFHRIIKTFMIQTGDPTGTGGGGPGYKFEDELNNGHLYEPGVVAMANAGPNTNGSQFFIGTGEDVKNLNSMPNYTIFGKVIEGMDVVEKIAATPVTNDPHSGEPSKPTEEVSIKTITIEEK